jgi:hypothetical protein
MDDRVATGRQERGFALILAILSLMLLTFLGLTLATTTSTELQIATNYRWSQQALYNAEAGLEAARIVLSQPGVADVGAQWNAVLPAVRTSPASWPPVAGSAPPPVETAAGRDFFHSDCDDRGGIGFGLVLNDGTTRYENVSDFAGETLNGAFTVWVRRGLRVDNAGLYSDETRNDTVVIVSEGVAPYTGPGDAFTQSHQAVRVLETRFALALNTAGEPCGLGRQQGQEGGSPMGENFNPCANLVAGAGGTLGGVFGGAEAGGLTSTGVQ